jgi:hypothetical protein
MESEEVTMAADNDQHASFKVFIIKDLKGTEEALAGQGNADWARKQEQGAT